MVDRQKEASAQWLAFAGGVPAAIAFRDLPPVISPERFRAQEGSLFGEIPNFLTPEQRLLLSQISHPRRRQQWIQARHLERELRTALMGPCRVSLSHSHPVHREAGMDASGWVVGVAADLRFAGIGVDLEWADRPIRSGVGARFIGAEDLNASQGHLSELDFWVLKEAAFKATPENAGLLVSDFWLHSWDPLQREGEMTSAHLKSLRLFCRVKLHLLDAHWKLAFAWSREQLK